MRNNGYFEGKFLVNMVNAIIQQDPRLPEHNSINWERVYHLADYHRIANIIYLGILGRISTVPRFWKDKFNDRYRSALQYNTIYEKAENEIMNLYQVREMHPVVIESSAIRALYKIQETAYNNPLRMFLDRQEYITAKGYLIDIGYETDRFYKGFGEHMHRNKDGFNVEIYYRLPFLSRTYNKFMYRILDHAVPDRRLPNISTLTLEYNFVYRMAEAVYRYCSDDLRIRYLLDTYLFYEHFREEMNMDLVELRLEAMNIDEAADALLDVAALWFGKRTGKRTPAGEEAEQSQYANLEMRILSNGNAGMDTIPQILNIRDEIERANGREEQHEKNEEGMRSFRSLFSAKARHEKKEQAKELSARILTKGDVAYVPLKKHEILVYTPYFTVRVPEVWLGHSTIECSPNHEDMRFPSDRDLVINPDNYSVRFYFSSPDSVTKIPILSIDLYSDIFNRQIQRSFREELMFYMGAIEHQTDDGSLTSHLVARYDEDTYDGWDKTAFYEMVDGLDLVLDSIQPIYDKRAGNFNSYRRYKEWHWGDLPEEYYEDEEQKTS